MTRGYKYCLIVDFKMPDDNSEYVQQFFGLRVRDIKQEAREWMNEKGYTLLRWRTQKLR